MRLDKLLSNLKYGSRKEIKALVKERAITVNGEVATSSNIKIDPIMDEIYIYDEKIIYYKELNLAMYKPKDYLSANHDNYFMTVIDLLVEPYSRYDFAIAGRLDLDSEGLLVLTTNGSFAHQIMSPNSEIEKVYEVVLDKDLEEKDANKLLSGFHLTDRDKTYYAKAINIEYDKNISYITITEGKFHQVKKMFLEVGYVVQNLKRIKIGNLELKDLEPGEFRIFDKEELL